MELKSYPVGATFGLPNIDPSITVMGGADPSHHAIPRRNPDYIIRVELLRDLLAPLSVDPEGSEWVYLEGPMGCGKSSLIRQVAALLNIPVFEVTANKDTEFVDLLGHHTVCGGDMLWVDGPLTNAYREGAWFVINEQNLMRPGAAAGLNEIGEMLTIAENGGEMLRPAPGFRFFCTGNDLAGLDADIYQDTQKQNGAFLDRFYMMRVGYPSPDDEVQLVLGKVPALGRPLVEKLVEYANEVRGLFAPTDGRKGIDVTMSTRTLLRWARYCAFFGSKMQGEALFTYALDRSLTFRADPATRLTMMEMVQRKLGGP